MNNHQALKLIQKRITEAADLPELFALFGSHKVTPETLQATKEFFTANFLQQPRAAVLCSMPFSKSGIPVVLITKIFTMLNPAEFSLAAVLSTEFKKIVDAGKNQVTTSILLENMLPDTFEWNSDVKEFRLYKRHSNLRSYTLEHGVFLFRAYHPSVCYCV